MLNLNLKDLKINHLILFLCFLAVTLPGFAHHLFDHEALFFEVDLIRLTIMSIIFSMPLLLISLFASVSWAKPNNEPLHSDVFLLHPPVIVLMCFSIAVVGYWVQADLYAENGISYSLHVYLNNAVLLGIAYIREFYKKIFSRKKKD